MWESSHWVFGAAPPGPPSEPTMAVVGFGATTPLGGDVASTWEALLAGRSGVSVLEQDWVTRCIAITKAVQD